jgi:acyl carrier protein
MARQTPAERPTRDRVVALLLDGVRALLEERGEPAPVDLNEDTRLIGPDAVVTSLGLVSLIVGLEQALDDEFGVSIILADERAMSLRHSPFRTVGTLATYACEQAGGT